MRAVTRSITLPAPISATAIIAEVAEDLVRIVRDEYFPRERTISLLAISVSHLTEDWAGQFELSFGLAGDNRRPGTRRATARWDADTAMDKVRGRFGWEAIGYGSVVLELRKSIPDAFRELAEKNL